MWSGRSVSRLAKGCLLVVLTVAIHVASAAGQIASGRMQPRVDGLFRPFGTITAISLNQATATRPASMGEVGGLAIPLAWSTSITMQLPSLLQNRVLPGQPVWLSIDGKEAAFIEFPIEVPSTRTIVGRGSGRGQFWIETRNLMVSNTGIISGTSQTQSEDYINGFTGSVWIRLRDSEGNETYPPQLGGCWGVNLRSGRTEFWSIRIPAEAVSKTATVELFHLHSACGRDRFAAAAEQAGIAAEAFGKWLELYASSSGGARR